MAEIISAKAEIIAVIEAYNIATEALLKIAKEKNINQTPITALSTSLAELLHYICKVKVENTKEAAAFECEIFDVLFGIFENPGKLLFEFNNQAISPALSVADGWINLRDSGFFKRLTVKTIRSYDEIKCRDDIPRAALALVKLSAEIDSIIGIKDFAETTVTRTRLRLESVTEADERYRSSLEKIIEISELVPCVIDKLEALYKDKYDFLAVDEFLRSVSMSLVTDFMNGSKSNECIAEVKKFILAAKALIQSN